MSWIEDNETYLWQRNQSRYEATTYQDQMGYWAVHDRAADKYATRRSFDRDAIFRKAAQLNAKWSRKMQKRQKQQNPLSSVPTREVSGYVRRLPSGKIQVKIPLSSLRRKRANPRRRRNIAGFMDSEGQFHPIRAGTRIKAKGKRKVKVADKRAYSRKRAGEKKKVARRKVVRRKVRVAKRKTTKRKVAKRRRSNPRTEYEVIVGNIGSVHSGRDLRKAIRVFNEYAEQSQGDYGRAAGEDVTLMRDGHPYKEYYGSRSGGGY